MSAPFNDVFAKTCEAGAGLLAAIPLGAPVYQGEGTEDMVTPCVRLYAETAEEEDPQYSGNFWANFNAEVIYPAPVSIGTADTKAPNDLLVQTVFDTFSSSTLPTDLNALASPVDDFTCIAVRNRQVRFETSGNQWINTLTMQLLVCASSLYP